MPTIRCGAQRKDPLVSLDTPLFAKLPPMLTVIRRHSKEILLSAFARMAEAICPTASGARTCT
jgi:hypothetical protein